MFSKNNIDNNQNNVFNYYPDDSSFYKNNNQQSQQSGLNFETLISILNNNSSPIKIIKNLSSNNPQLTQIMSIMNLMQPTQKKVKKTTTKISDCKYVSVKDYYSSKKEDS